ncbi:MAG: VWA domain-containing protein, partial [Treponemataceae bacterium]|nr:VWA domain-containing protein [Treponemataceae bacterium]
LLYRDYGDSFDYRGLPVQWFYFTRDLDEFARNLSAFTVRGNEGGDVPEAVYEALADSIEWYEWRPDAEKKSVLIRDAEPHPRPRASGQYT